MTALERRRRIFDGRSNNLIVRIRKSEAEVTNNKKTALEVLYC